MQRRCRHASTADFVPLMPLQEVYTSKDVKKLLAQLQSDLMAVVDKVCVTLLQRRQLCQTMHCLLEPVHASRATGLLHLLPCQPGACT